LGVSALVLPRAAAAASAGSGGTEGPALLQVLRAESTGCSDAGKLIYISVYLVAATSDDIRFSISGNGDDWRTPDNVEEQDDGEVEFTYEIPDEAGCESTVPAALRDTPTVRVGRFVGGVLQFLSEPLRVDD
jgi:hypothetical protein